MEIDGKKPRLFIGSSTDGVKAAQAIEVRLNDCADVTLWNNGVFGLGDGTLEALTKAASEFDFAVLVLTAPDVTISGDLQSNAPRDNVLFETGLFMGRLGRERTFIVRPTGDIKMPSDLAGVTVATYDPDRGSGDLRKAMAGACYEIEQAICRLGSLGGASPETAAMNLNDLITSVKAASRFNHPVFMEEVRAQCREWGVESRPWIQGKIVVRKNYQLFLANAYQAAGERIFSTSIPQYRNAWQTAWGKALLRAQSREGLKSTRVFIFGAAADVTATDEEIFQEHADAGIEVLIYTGSKEPPFLFPPEIGADWTLIDGPAANGGTEKSFVGVTRQVGDIFEAEWYFGDAQQAARFLSLERQLRFASLSLETWGRSSHGK